METKIIEKSLGVSKKVKKGVVIEINLVEDVETFASIKFSDKIWNNIKEYMFIIEYMDDKLNTNIISAPNIFFVTGQISSGFNGLQTRKFFI